MHTCVCVLINIRWTQMTRLVGFPFVQLIKLNDYKIYVCVTTLFFVVGYLIFMAHNLFYQRTENGIAAAEKKTSSQKH